MQTAMLCGHKSRFAKICQAHKPPSTKSNGKKPLQCTGSSAAFCMNVTSKIQRSHSSSDQTLPDCSCFHVSFSTAVFFLLDSRCSKTLQTTPCLTREKKNPLPLINKTNPTQDLSVKTVLTVGFSMD